MPSGTAERKLFGTTLAALKLMALNPHFCFAHILCYGIFDVICILLCVILVFTLCWSMLLLSLSLQSCPGICVCFLTFC